MMAVVTMVTILIMTMTITNKDDKGAINWQSHLIMGDSGGSDGSVNKSNSKDDWMADNTMDDLIAGKKARLKKSLSSCSTWMEVKENEDKNYQ